jgi:hypothetical protein
MFAVCSFNYQDSNQNMVLKIYFPDTKRVLLSIFDHKEMKENHAFLAQAIMKIVGSLREKRLFDEER